MKCPRCHTQITAGPSQGGSVVCPGCGARLRTRNQPPVAGAGADFETALSRLGPGGDPENPSATLPPGTPLFSVPSPAMSAPAGAEQRAEEGGVTLAQVLEELRAVRTIQAEILQLLRQPPGGRGGSSGSALPEAVEDAAFPPVRARRRKTVLLVDDDPGTREAAVLALEGAEVPVRVVEDGNASLAAIAEEKPDVIVLELAMAGAMGGKDVVNMIKATMEWVDIPIVLYTRLAIETQREVRQIHGADDYVLKGPGAAEALVARVITLFRRA